MNDSWPYTGNAGVWAQMTVDEELGLVYLPVELPTGDYYGGHRPGNNSVRREPRRRRPEDRQASGTTSSCTTASGTSTSRARRSSPTSPSTGSRSRRRAADQAGLGLRVRSRDRPAGLADRGAAGPKGDVPGEWYSPTQPFRPSRRRSIGRGVSIDDLIDFTPELRAEGA